ncbi:MAG TPA: MarR family transcriptional regulator [Solirubrobacteraceae bacterium]|jgi:DNA-binding MarR family transcriptional regulator
MASSTEAPAPPAELSPGELAAWRGLLRVHAALMKALDAELESEHGLPLTSYEVLLFLRAAPGGRLRMADLADRVLLSRSGMTRLVDRLERDGLIARAQCPRDARGCFAVLTPDGEAVLERARPTHLGGIRERFLRHFSAQELEHLAGCWDRVVPGAAQV